MSTNLAVEPQNLAQRLRVLLVPTDFSSPAEEALRHAEQLAKHGGSRIVLFHVFDDSDYIVGTALGLGGPNSPVMENRARARAMANDKLQRLADRTRATGAEVEPILYDGSPVESIVNEANNCHADLVVMSTHGRTGWRRFVMGSVAEHVIRYASCPVLAIHAHPPAVPAASSDSAGLAAPPMQLRRILVPTDFSVRAEAALPWAELLAQAAAAEMTLLHVMPPAELASTPFDPAFAWSNTSLAEVYEAAIEGRGAQLQAAIRPVVDRGGKADCMLMHGQAADKIVEAAQAGRYDLVVMSTHGTTNWTQAFMGRTTEKVVRTAACPVLVVRERLSPEKVPAPI